MELLAGLVRSGRRAATEQRLIAESAIASRYFGSAGSSQNKAPEHFRGLVLELLAGLVRSGRRAATEQRLIAESAIASRYFGSAGSSQNKAPEHFRGLVLELLAGLEPATYCHPQKNAAGEARQEGSPFFGDPVCLIFGRTDSNLTIKSKQKSIPERMPFCLELLAGLEPATC